MDQTRGSAAPTRHGVRALVIHPGALGDVLQAVPALRALGATARVTFAGQPRLGRLLADTGIAGAALAFDTLGLEMLFTRGPVPPTLRERLAGFDRVVSWFGARDPIYPERLRTLAPECIVASPVGEEPGVPVWRHLAATLGIQAVTSLDVAPLRAPVAWRSAARQSLLELGIQLDRRLLVIHPGAGATWKLWSAELLAEVIGQALAASNAHLLIHQGPADREAAERLLSLLGGPVCRLIQPELSLLAGVLGDASAYVGGDSGVSHLAAAVGCRPVILFPPETRERWAPWSPSALALSMEEEIERIAAAVAERLEASAAFAVDAKSVNHPNSGGEEITK